MSWGVLSPQGVPLIMAEFGGSLYVGGEFFFQHSSGNTRSIVRLDAGGAVPVAGGLAMTGSAPRVNAMTVHNGELIVGGSFNIAGGFVEAGRNQGERRLDWML